MLRRSWVSMVLAALIVAALLVNTGCSSSKQSEGDSKAGEPSGSTAKSEAATQAPSADDLKKIVIAFPSPTVSTLPLRMALNKGFYKAENLDVELVQINPNVAASATAQGADVDYSTALGAIIKAALQGMDIRIVSMVLPRAMHYLVAKSEIKTVPQLKGKSIRINSMGDLQHVEAKAALEKYGIKESEVNMIAISGEPNGFAALEAGHVDAAVLAMPTNLMAEAKGFNRLMDLYDVLPLGTSGLGVSIEKINKNPGEVHRVIRATLKGMSYMRQNKAETVQLLVDWMNMDPQLAEKAYNDVISAYAYDGIGSLKNLEVNVESARQQLKIEKPVPITAAFDLRLVEELKAQSSK